MEWISVKDRIPPRELDYIIVFDGNDVFTAMFFVNDGKATTFFSCCYGKEYLKIKNVTHWMPLPEPPEKND